MNAWGSAGCREHLDEIVDHLLEEAKKRSWRLRVGIPLSATAGIVNEDWILPGSG